MKPAFWRSPDVLELTVFQRLLYIGLFNFSDDHGRGLFDPMSIAADVFLREYSRDPAGVAAEIEEAFAAYSSLGMVTVYRVGRREYYQINAWHAHQKINRPQPSKVPPPDQGEQLDHGAITESSVNGGGIVREASVSAHGLGREGSMWEEEGEAEIHAPFTEPSVNPEPAAPSTVSPDQLLDELAARAFRKEKYPGAFGTPDDPRCEAHAALDPGNVPNCHRCAEARRIFEEHDRDAQARAKSERRAAIDACPVCDENGWREVPGGLARCDHAPGADDVPPWEAAL